MKLNKQGFTLVEILVVIVLISLVLGLGIPGIMKLSENMKKRSLNSKINIVESAAVVWGNDNKTLLKKTICEINGLGYDCYKLSLGNLIEEDYLPSESLDKISYLNPSNKEELINNCIYIYKRNNKVYSYLAIDDKTCVYKSNDDINEEPDVPESNEEDEDGIIRIPDVEQPIEDIKKGAYIPDYTYSSVAYCDNECVEKGNVCSKEEIQNGIYCQVILSDKHNSYYEPEKIMNFHVLKNTEDELYLLSDNDLYDDIKNEYVKITSEYSLYNEINAITTNWNRLIDSVNSNQNKIYRKALGYYENTIIKKEHAEFYYNTIVPDYYDFKELNLGTDKNGNYILPVWATYYSSIDSNNKFEKIWLNNPTSYYGHYDSDLNYFECESSSGYYDGEGCSYSGGVVYGCMYYDSSRVTILDDDCESVYTFSSGDSLNIPKTKIILPLNKYVNYFSNVDSKIKIIDIDLYYSYLDAIERGGTSVITPLNSFDISIDDELWGEKNIELKYFLYNNNLYVSNIYVNKLIGNGSDYYSQPNPGMECKFYYNNKELELEFMGGVDSVTINNTNTLYKTTTNNIPISNNTIQNGNIEYKCYNYELLPHSDGGYYIEKEMIKSGTLF